MTSADSTSNAHCEEKKVNDGQHHLMHQAGTIDEATRLYPNVPEADLRYYSSVPFLHHLEHRELVSLHEAFPGPLLGPQRPIDSVRRI